MKAFFLKWNRAVKWSRKNLFSGPLSTLITVLLMVFLFKTFFPLFNWAIAEAHWNTTAMECREGGGACWSFIGEKARYILFGHYPRSEQWRAVFFILSIFLLFFLGQFRRLWSKYLIWACAVFPFVGTLLMRGGFPGLELVKMEDWGGLPLTLLLAFVGIVVSYPLGILLALGRRSSMPVINALSVCYIELIRGVPLISILFMGSVMFPLLLPEGVTISKVLRAQAAMILFSSAYMAEVVRGGLQAIPRGQYEAAKAIGLGYGQTMGLVVLPQALKIVIPPTVNTFIGLFKDTSLVFIISLSDLLFTTKASFKDAEWLGFSVEGYFFAAFIYFVFCYFMGRVSFRIETEMSR
ncbi:MAG: amino acid ABC transporter permease [Bacteriovoracales bacterium]|nr:amino acid ABC transporter permease [Bacteriovoracales bacterium]